MKEKCALRVLCLEKQKEFFVEYGVPVEDQPDPCTNCTICKPHEDGHD